MATTTEDLNRLMESDEDEHLEFKRKSTRGDFDELTDYCVAMANEGGGRLVLGVTDKKPRRVVGTDAFLSLAKVKASLYERIQLRVEAEEVHHPGGRVVFFTVPPRPQGHPLSHRGQYWMRAGESLVPMSNDRLRAIFSENDSRDYSAEPCRGATNESLAAGAISTLRCAWERKSENVRIGSLSDRQLLEAMELIIDGTPTIASIILLGTKEATARFVPQAEVIYEFRSADNACDFQKRLEFREGFLLFQDDLWTVINARNDIQHYQDGLFVWDVPSFNERVIREAILNAICHRDYTLAGASVFIRHSPSKFEIVSPGGFLPGITPGNMIWKQEWRNRRIAEVLAKCGMVERSGQGADLMFEESIREGKGIPDYGGTDPYQVSLRLSGAIQEPRLMRFLEKLGRERVASFTTEDFVVLEFLYRDEPLPDIDDLKKRVPFLRDEGLIEPVSRGSHKYVLSKQFYGFIGRRGVYTRRKGLDRNTNKQLLLQHIQNYQEEGTRMEDLKQVLPSLTRHQIQTLLRELRSEGRIFLKGQTKASKWYCSAHSQ